MDKVVGDGWRGIDGHHASAGNIADVNQHVNYANDWVGYDDMILLTDKWLSNEVPLAEDLNRNGIVDFAD